VSVKEVKIREEVRISNVAKIRTLKIAKLFVCAFDTGLGNMSSYGDYYLRNAHDLLLSYFLF
jgi:hypothetical protein